VKLLLNYEVGIYKAYDDLTPGGRALARGHKDVAELLRPYEASHRNKDSVCQPTVQPSPPVSKAP
jgi:hypothetical protein